LLEEIYLHVQFGEKYLQMLTLRNESSHGWKVVIIYSAEDKTGVDALSGESLGLVSLKD
jgi:hypothetical protein